MISAVRYSPVPTTDRYLNHNVIRGVEYCFSGKSGRYSTEFKTLEQTVKIIELSIVFPSITRHHLLSK